MAEGLLVIRATIGLLLFAHGAQKLFGWWGGHGLDGTGGFFAQIGHRPGRSMALIAGLSEAGGGALLALGFLTPLGSAMVLGVMFVAAASVHAPHGLWATNGGYELPMTNGLIALGLAFTGAGSWSIDAAAGIPGMSGWWAGIGALLLATVASALAMLRRQHVLATEAATQAYPAEAVPADPATADADAVNAGTAAGEHR